MKWAKERDSLIAQTRAFVNSVIAWKADTTLPSRSVQHVAIENTFTVTLPVATEAVEAIQQPESVEPAQALPTAELPLAEEIPQSDIRSEIQSRVAAFQAHQQRFAREREAYFNSVLTKARSGTGGNGEKPSA
jgi:hypothetical protein